MASPKKVTIGWVKAYINTNHLTNRVYAKIKNNNVPTRIIKLVNGITVFRPNVVTSNGVKSITDVEAILWEEKGTYKVVAYSNMYNQWYKGNKYEKR